MSGNSTEPSSTKMPAQAGRRSRAILPGKTLAAFVVAVIAIFVTVGMSYQSLKAHTAAAVSVNHSNEVRQQLNLFLSDLTPADVYFGRGQAILQERHRIKQKTIEHRSLLHRKLAA